MLAVRRGRRKPGRLGAEVAGNLLELAVTVLLLLGARGRVVRHEQFSHDPDRRADALAGAVRGDDHSRFDGPVAGGGKPPFLASVLELDFDGANAADADRGHVFAVA